MGRAQSAAVAEPAHGRHALLDGADVLVRRLHGDVDVGGAGPAHRQRGVLSVLDAGAAARPAAAAGAHWLW